MDHSKHVESTLNALLLNATDLKNAGDDSISSKDLLGHQKQLLDTLFHSWNELNDQEQKTLLAAKVETKVHELAKKNQECLKIVLPEKNF